MSPVASLDLGTHTFRLLIADVVSPAGLSPLLTQRAVTRLGEGYAQGRMIQPWAINRSMEVLEDFANIIAHYRVDRVIAVATGVVREAENGEAFTKEVYNRTGIPVRILSGCEEAQLILKGVLSAVDPETLYALVFDIGGGSTEFILTEGAIPLKTESITLGVIGLSETLITSDPPTSRELSRLHTAIRKYLSPIDFHDALRTAQASEDASSLSLIGTAGTVTTLAAIDQKMEIYEPRTINNHRLSRETLLTIYQHLTTVTAAQRTAIPGLEKGREIVIVPGTAIVLEIMKLFKCNHLIVSDGGLLEGILLEHKPFH